MNKTEELVLPIFANHLRARWRLKNEDVAKLTQDGKLQLACNGKPAFVAVQTRNELPADSFYASSWRKREERVHVFILFPQGASAKCREKAVETAKSTYASLCTGRTEPPVSIRVAVDENGQRNFILKLPS